MKRRSTWRSSWLVPKHKIPHFEPTFTLTIMQLADLLKGISTTNLYAYLELVSIPFHFAHSSRDHPYISVDNKRVIPLLRIWGIFSMLGDADKHRYQ